MQLPVFFFRLSDTLFFNRFSLKKGAVQKLSFNTAPLFLVLRRISFFLSRIQWQDRMFGTSKEVMQHGTDPRIAVGKIAFSL